MGAGSAAGALERWGFPGGSGQVRVRRPNDGLTGGAGAADLGNRLVASSGHGISGNPFVTWVPTGGPNGRVLLMAGEITNSLTDYATTGNTPHSALGPRPRGGHFAQVLYLGPAGVLCSPFAVKNVIRGGAGNRKSSDPTLF